MTFTGETLCAGQDPTERLGQDSAFAAPDVLPGGDVCFAGLGKTLGLRASEELGREAACSAACPP